MYAEFKASLATPLSRPAQAHAPKEMVKVVKRYRYAGEEITYVVSHAFLPVSPVHGKYAWPCREVKEVAADSEEAKKWPRWQPSDDAANAESSASAKTSGASGVAPSSSTPTPATNTPAAKPAGKRPGPRKAKSKLADIPTRKEPIKRLTTLDKSAMDWRAHVEGEASADVKDELEANRRGGGYLEKVEFLQRVEARKEEVLDANKGKRRR